ncbi:MAG: hypothetical protein ABI175_01265 [Polyangiales bacterium]
MTNARLVALFALTTFVLGTAPACKTESTTTTTTKDDEAKKKKKKSGDDDDDDDDDKGKKKKGDEDDDDELDIEKVCKHVRELCDDDPKAEHADRFAGDEGEKKCVKQVGKIKDKKGDKVYADCLKCLNKAKDVEAAMDGCEAACDGKK